MDGDRAPDWLPRDERGDRLRFRLGQRGRPREIARCMGGGERARREVPVQIDVALGVFSVPRQAVGIGRRQQPQGDAIGRCFPAQPPAELDQQIDGGGFVAMDARHDQERGAGAAEALGARLAGPASSVRFRQTERLHRRQPGDRVVWSCVVLLLARALFDPISRSG